MQSSSQTEQSTNSPYAGVSGVQQFETADHAGFHVEWTEKGEDVIYHFWPPADGQEFVENFHLYLESAFQRTLPPHQKVTAAYTSLEEANVQMSVGYGAVPRKDMDLDEVQPRATYYVRVHDCLQAPLARTFLFDRVFTLLQSLIDEGAV